MRHMFAAVVIVGVACTNGQTTNGQTSSQTPPELGSIGGVALESRGYVPLSTRTGVMEEGGIARTELGLLEAGKSYAILGACHCPAFDMTLLGPNEAFQQKANMDDQLVAIRFVAETSGALAVEASTVRCGLPSCGWSVQAWVDGLPWSDAARRHDGDLDAGDNRYPTGEFFDTYAFDANAGDTLIADLRSSSFLPHLNVESPSGVVWWTERLYGHDRSRVEIIAAPETGRWTVRVTSREPVRTGPYGLLLEARAPSEEDLRRGQETRPLWRGRQAYATPLGGERRLEKPAQQGRDLLGAPVEGSLASGDPRLKDGRYSDTHVFQGAAGDRVTIALTTGGFDPTLMLFAPNGELVRDEDGYYSSAGIGVELATTGEYRVLVTSSERGDTGSYVLSVTAAPVTPENR